MNAIDISGGADLAKVRGIAEEALGAFAAISRAAAARLTEPGQTLASLAVINQATAERVAEGMRQRNDQRLADCQRLRVEPAIARLVIADEHDEQETIYISSCGTVDQPAVKLCSYMSPKGRLASLSVGQGRDIRLPGSTRYFEVLEKVTFQPVEDGSGWDARPAVQFREHAPPLTVKSLRDLLIASGLSQEAIDLLDAWEADDEVAIDDNVMEGLIREALTAMQLRVAPILDQFQDDIFRLKLDSQLAVLGPPGTGKTTTLVKRLRQKVDFAYLDAETEQPLVEKADDAGLAHADSWIMFTPTELLRLYVQEAFGRAGVPVHDERLKTWDDYRRQIGRHHLRLLKTGSGAGLVLRTDDRLLLEDAITNQTGWYEAFDRFQQAVFFEQLQAEATRLAAAAEGRAALLGRQIGEAIDRAQGKPLQLLGELAGLWAGLREVAGAGHDELRAELERPLRDFAAADPMFLSALRNFVENLDQEVDEEAEEDEPDADDEDIDTGTSPHRGAKLARETAVKAMRARAIAQASGRSPAAASRSGRLLGWMRERGLALPDLRRTGEALLVQRAAARLARAPADYLTKLPIRYRGFRRAMRELGQWYAPGRGGALDAHPVEIDLILLAMLRTARAMEDDRLLAQRIANRRPPVLDEIARMRRNQVLVDEATDFSPVQLACMRALASRRTDSFFASGDFNQRLTRWGSRTEAELQWVSPGIEIRRIDITYRQSRRLAEFARRLAEVHGYDVSEQAPEHIENLGVVPVLGLALDSPEAQARWLAARIQEIDRFPDGTLPTIAVLVCDEQAMEPLATALSAELEELNIRAVACPKGMVKGQQGDVRIFEVEHIKGLEFEAVFFMDIDRLHERQPDLFDRYIYVGATRAATFLGLASRTGALPGRLQELQAEMAASW